MTRVAVASRVAASGGPRERALPQIVFAQNLLLQSESLSNASWTKGTGCTATDATSDFADPNGGNTAMKLVYDGSGSVGGTRFSQNPVTAATYNLARSTCSTCG